MHTNFLGGDELNLYTASGTADFLQKVVDKYPKEQMILLSGTDKSMILHETEGKTVFSLPQKYVVAESYGSLEQFGFYVLHHFSADGGNRDMLVQQFKNVLGKLTEDPTIRSFRLLTPKKGKGHVVFVTHWSGPHSYEAWKNSNIYKNHFESLLNVEAQSIQKIFDGDNYVATYNALPKE